MLTYLLLKEKVPAPGAEPDWAWFLAKIPGFLRLESTPQDKIYHGEGNVLIHTKMVVWELLGSVDYLNASDDERFVLFYAALLHDIAKPITTVIDAVTGKIGQPGHSKKGAVDVRILFWDAEVPFDIRETVCRLIHAHQVPFYAVPAPGEEGARSGKSPEFIVRELSWQVSLPLLAALAEADMRGRICADKQKVLDSIDRFRIMAMDEGCYGTPRRFATEHTRVSYFRGANVHPDYELYQNPGSRVTVMCGLQASGKNFWVAKNRPDWAVVSFDDALEHLGLKHGKNNGKAVHFAIDRAKELLRQKVPFVWNATNLTRQQRDKTLDLLYRYDAEVELVYLEKPRGELLRRNTKRDTTLTNKTLESMLHKWELPTPTEAHRTQYLV